jgi:hypothetical protein
MSSVYPTNPRFRVFGVFIEHPKPKNYQEEVLPLLRLHPDVAGQEPCTTTLDEVEVTAPTSLIRATRSGIPLVRQA